MLSLNQIAHIENDFKTKFGVPFQSNVVKNVSGTIVFEEEYRNAQMLRGLEDFSHIWLIWGFSENNTVKWSPTVRPPRLGGNVRKGVFATRSPFRPNPVGLSSVRIEKIFEHPFYGTVIDISGADMVSGTPIYDIKPYIAFTDSHPNAFGGFSQSPEKRRLKVVAGDHFREHISQAQEDILKDILSFDPRPQYHNDTSRIYGMDYGRLKIKFKVSGNILFVLNVKRIS